MSDQDLLPVYQGKYPHIIVKYIPTVYGVRWIEFVGPKKKSGQAPGTLVVKVPCKGKAIVEDKLTEAGREAALKQTRKLAKKERREACLVISPDEALYVDPDGTVTSGLPPLGGIRMDHLGVEPKPKPETTASTVPPSPVVVDDVDEEEEVEDDEEEETPYERRLRLRKELWMPLDQIPTKSVFLPGDDEGIFDYSIEDALYGKLSDEDAEAWGQIAEDVTHLLLMHTDTFRYEQEVIDHGPCWEQVMYEYEIFNPREVARFLRDYIHDKIGAFTRWQ